jgi:hypothetical protein
MNPRHRTRLCPPPPWLRTVASPRRRKRPPKKREELQPGRGWMEGGQRSESEVSRRGGGAREHIPFARVGESFGGQEGPRGILMFVLFNERIESGAPKSHSLIKPARMMQMNYSR